MGGEDSRPERMRTALFVDFDNIYINLADDDRDAATVFARNPEKWVDWLTHRAAPFYHDTTGCRRKIILRRCYMNPQQFAEFRPNFIRSAFEVVDCPPLTVRGKTSTDIHLVMDALDTLNHPVHVDEFIIFSGDADFTPLLLRLRKHDRMTAVLSAGYVSPAYKAASDAVIPLEGFIQHALGIRPPEESPAGKAPGMKPSAETLALLTRMGERLSAAAGAGAGIPANEIPEIYMEFEEFRSGQNWIGLGSLRALTEAVIEQRDDLAVVERDPWRVARRERKNGALPAAAAADACPTNGESANDVAGAPGPEDEFHQKHPAVAPLAIKIHTVTGTPYLLPEHYGLLFREAAREIRESGYMLYRNSKNVRDRCVERGAPISRSQVNFILQGYKNSERSLDQKFESAENLAEIMVRWVLGLCRTSQLNLNEFEVGMVRQWLCAPQ
jgi:hypothetical protein